jgi:hypothetical protein
MVAENRMPLPPRFRTAAARRSLIRPDSRKRSRVLVNHIDAKVAAPVHLRFC